MYSASGLGFSNLAIRALPGVLEHEDSPALGFLCIWLDEAGADDEPLCHTGAIILHASEGQACHRACLLIALEREVG
jgi:hypothetical protein